MRGYGYYTNNRAIFYRQVVVLFPNSEPVHFASSDISQQAADRRSFVEDCRVSENLMSAVIALLKERGISAGRIGANFEMLSASWYLALEQELPQIKWVETHERILDTGPLQRLRLWISVRFIKSSTYPASASRN